MDLEKKLKQTRKACGFAKHNPSKKSLSMRPTGKGWMFVKTEDGRLAWIRIRKLTPRECGRLMDVDEDKLDIMLNASISDSQLYRMFGNSIVVSCMEGIFYNLFSEEQPEEQGQLSLF